MPEKKLEGVGRELIGQVEGLRDEVRRVEGRRKRDSVRTWIAIALLTLGIIFAGGTSYLVYDCTNPNGKCSKRGAAGQSKAVATINYGTIAANWCSHTSSTEDTYLQCIMTKVPEYQERFES